VSIERLGIYTLVGSLIGVLIGIVYKAIELRKIRAAKFKESMQIDEGDRAPELLIKALMLNSQYRGKKVFFQNKTKKIYGYHYARSENSIYIFAHFILISSRLKPDVQKKVLAAAGPRGDFGKNRQRMLAVLKLLSNEDKEAFQIADPVFEVALTGKSSPVNQEQAYLRIDEEQYLQPQYEETQDGYLLEILDQEL